MKPRKAQKIHPLFHHLSKKIRRSSHKDFSSIPEYNEAFQEQDTIPFNKTMNFAAAAAHYNFHIPSVIRFAGGNYTTEYRDI
eukprot:4811221-Ditylum_brightwellii.AAC.1